MNRIHFTTWDAALAFHAQLRSEGIQAQAGMEPSLLSPYVVRWWGEWVEPTLDSSFQEFC